ncbi:hypothetical protein GQ43DRAFT_434877 [Delitschia confertaspora ATCC 74209]|uniref:Uncharacterized protein n=1 Tax=Delitschia confertaspora ATCC 74209 TaxID=1513339 RepID=A0A9P4JJP6_9PLEO|nr:hypothetical protein GQ43DRAFT_434877 [Delitschia confertaspora ATCC 74209]
MRIYSPSSKFDSTHCGYNTDFLSKVLEEDKRKLKKRTRSFATRVELKFEIHGKTENGWRSEQTAKLKPVTEGNNLLLEGYGNPVTRANGTARKLARGPRYPSYDSTTFDHFAHSPGTRPDEVMADTSQNYRSPQATSGRNAIPTMYGPHLYFRRSAQDNVKGQTVPRSFDEFVIDQCEDILQTSVSPMFGSEAEQLRHGNF